MCKTMPAITLNLVHYIESLPVYRPRSPLGKYLTQEQICVVNERLTLLSTIGRIVLPRNSRQDTSDSIVPDRMILPEEPAFEHELMWYRLQLDNYEEKRPISAFLHFLICS